MAKLTAAEMIEAIKEMSVLELNDLVKKAEEEFGVSAAAVAAARRFPPQHRSHLRQSAGQRPRHAVPQWNLLG